MFLAWFVVVLAASLIPPTAPSTVASSQGSEALLSNSVVFVVQGESEVVQGNETDNDFYMLRILTYNLPHDVTRVYTKVPAIAENLFVWTSTQEINNSGYGFESSGQYSGDFYIDVPASHPRTTYASNATDDEIEFNASGSQFLNTTFSEGSLHLVPGNDSGVYVSTRMPVIGAYTIESATLNYSGNSTSNITSYMSNDDGATWTSCTNNTLTAFSSTGTALKIRFEFDGNTSLGYDPAIYSFSANATYILNSTTFNAHVSCTWTQQFLERRTLLDLSEGAPFSTGGTYLLMLYVVPGYTIESSGLELTFDADKTMSTYLDKDLYFNMTSPSSQSQTFEVTLLAPEEQSMVMYYVAGTAIVVSLGVAFVLSRRSKKTPAASDDEAEDDAETEKEPLSETDEAERKVLVARKKELLSEIEDVKAGMASGSISKADAEKKLVDLKKEFKVVRNELNRISRRSFAEVSDSIAGQSQSPSEYESVLAALARIDDDFEKGRLPESTHKNLRDEYMAKAVELRAEQEPKKSALEAEKEKLMGAIVALDDERERGEVDEKVYTELKSSYRKQLMELLRREEE